MNAKKIALTLLTISLLSPVLSSLAWSHATARISTPENGAVLSESPTEISIQFNGPAKLVSLTITGADGNPINIDISQATSVDGLVSVAIASLPADQYQASWRAMGVDGHVTAGKFSFEVSAAGK